MKILKKTRQKKFKKNELENYPLVEVKWYDISSESGWQSLNELQNSKLAVCITKGHLFSQSKGITRIFGDFALDENEEYLVEVGNTTIIPTACIIEIKKI